MNKWLEVFDEIAPFKGIFAPMRELSQFANEKDCGISLYEDDHAVYVEAPVAGVKPDEIQVTCDRRGVSIEGKADEEKENVKYHLKAQRSFSYWIPLPSGKIEENGKVDAVCKDGILRLTFPKSRAAKPLKISVKSA